MTDKPKLWSEMTTEEVKQTVKKALEHISKNSVLVDYPKATKKLANPKRKNKVCKDVVREIITEEDYQELVERCHKLQEQLNEANEVIKRCKRFETASKIERGVLVGVYPAWDYLKKWGVK